MGTCIWLYCNSIIKQGIEIDIHEAYKKDYHTKIVKVHTCTKIVDYLS